MIIKVDNLSDCIICDEFLTKLIQDEKKYDNTLDESFVVNDYFRNMINSPIILLLYKKEDKPVGYIFAKKDEDGYLIDGLYVDIDYRKCGVATELINEVIKQINSLGSYNIFIKVMKENKEAITLYKNFGFITYKENNLKYFMIYKYKLENANKSDIERIKQYKLKSILEYAVDLEPNEIERINNYVNKTISNQINNYKNIIINGNIVGSFLITKDKNEYLLDEIFIEEEYRGRGIGYVVLKDITTNINSSIYLWVYKNNSLAINMYKKLGFSIKDETEYRYYMGYIK